jgi:hypothetical protein
MIQARMAEEHARAPRSREWWLSAGVAVFAVIFRSAVLVAWPLAAFDSDQAITGLMAKHLAELRAFPVFYPVRRSRRLVEEPKVRRTEGCRATTRLADRAVFLSSCLRV